MFKSFLTALIALSLLVGAGVAEEDPNFQLQGRIGNPGRGQWEIGTYKGDKLIETGQYRWKNRKAMAWQVDYTATSNTLTWLWDIGGHDPQKYKMTLSEGINNGIQVYVNTTRPVLDPESIAVTDLVLTTASGSEFGEDLFASGSYDYDQFTFGTNITGDFTLTGKTTLSWLDSGPKKDRVEFRILDVSVAVPEPATLLILGGGLALTYVSRKRKK